MRKNWQYMLLAVVMAVFSWFLVNGQERVETVVDMSVIMSNPPEGLMVDTGFVDTIQVRLRGPKGLLRTLDNKRLVYDVDARNFRAGQNVVDINVDRIPVPSSFDIVELTPNRLTLVVDRIATKTVDVEAQWRGELNNFYVFDRIEVTPSQIRLRGPETRLRKITDTEVIMKENFPRDVPTSWVEHLALDLPEEVEATPSQVKVEAFFKPKTREIWVKMPLEVESPQGMTLRPRQDYVRMLIEGPLMMFRDNAFRKDIHVTLEPGQDLSPGERQMDYTVTVPEGVVVKKRNPDRIGVIIEKN